MFANFLRPRMTFSAKLYLATVLIVFTVAGSLIGLFITTQTRALDKAAERQGYALSKALAETVRVGLTLGDSTFIEDATHGIRQLPDLQFTVFFDAIGHPIVAPGMSHLPFQPSKLQFSEAVEKGTSILIMPATENKAAITVFISAVNDQENASLVGYIVLGISRAQIMKEQHQVLMLTLTTGLVLLAIVFLATFVLIRNLTRPLKALAHRARRIGRGELDVEVPVTTTDDLGRLADDFNIMVQSLRHTSMALTESEKKYRELFENIELPLFILDLNGRFLDFNDALQRICEPGPIITGESFCPILTDNGQPNALMRELLQSPVSISGRSIDWTRSNGDVCHLVISATVRRDDQGVPSRIEGMLSDTTELKSLESKLRQSQKLEAIGTLAGGIAHNFNNLLASMMVCAERVQQGTDPSDPNYPWLAQLRNTGKRGADVAKDLLRFARQDRPLRRPFSVGALVEELVQLLRATINPSTQIEQTVSDDTWLVQGDSGQIHQVLFNLCLNARDAIEEADGRQLTINADNVHVTQQIADTKHGVQAGAFIRISITDDGSGIPQALQERVFDPFFTTKMPNKGSGQGLSSAYGLVTGHGGFMELESLEGVGTTFHVFLPAATDFTTLKPLTLMPATKPVEVDPKPLRADGAERWILLAEDEDLLREALADYLERCGYRVTTARCGDEMLALLKTQGDQLDMVLTDATMPGVGIKAISDYLHKQHPELPLVLMSGYTQGALKDLYGLIHWDQFLTKPFDFDAIDASLNKLLNTDEK